MEGKMTELSELEAALRANGVQVSDGAVQRLLDRRKWIYHSERVDDLLQRLDQEQLYSLFNYRHHLRSAAQLFQFLASMRKKVSVVYGHKAQGKTQFLFFLFRLLQAMGERVLFLDRTIMPLEEDGSVDISDEKFCGHLWSDDFSPIGGEVKKCLESFFADALPATFGRFLAALRKHTRRPGDRIWIVIDEVVLFEKFLIRLPEEQDLGPFNWIVTGSAGIGSWVGKRHLEKRVFDLPLFTKEECLGFANNLCSALGTNLVTGMDGVPLEGMDDWLEERFGGVVGYIAEMFLEVSKGSLVSQYILVLGGRMNRIIRNSSTKNQISNKQLAEDWLNEIKSDCNYWECLRDAGLCGSFPPRGVIFTLILERLYSYFPNENEMLSLVTRFRLKFSGDPGLDGSLMKLEETLKFKANNSIEASLLTRTQQGWEVKESIDLPPKGIPLIFAVYEESSFRLDVAAQHSTSSSWYLIQVPVGFDVIDVVLVDVSSSPAIYGIQVSRSVKPFAKHHTLETCPSRSKTRLDKLWDVISKHFKLNEPLRTFFVMLAPNCGRAEFSKPTREHRSDYYFAPAGIIAAYPEPSRKRRSHSEAARLPPSKKC